jgi:BirA family biotin operon repressor/biotin-[acetyl-CoA-carboxylase] ligase
MLPNDPPAATLALVAAVALEQVAAAYLGPDRAIIKWPNDLLVGGAKLSGILLERTGDDAVVIGFGVNLAHHPEGLERPATSLVALGVGSPDPGLFLADLAESFAYWLARWRGEGLGCVRQRWLERAHPSGSPLSARLPTGQVVDGLFDGLDEGGALRLRTADGGVQLIHAADVFLM